MVHAFWFLSYHFSRIPRESGDNLCVHGTLLEREGKGSGDHAEKCGNLLRSGSSESTPTGQSGPVPGGERQRLQTYHWNSWILCHLDTALGIHWVYSRCLYWTSSMQAQASQLQSPHSWPLQFAKRHHRDNFIDTLAHFWDVTVAFLFELLRAQWSETLCPAHVNRGLLLNTDEAGTTH